MLLISAKFTISLGAETHAVEEKDAVFLSSISILLDKKRTNCALENLAQIQPFLSCNVSSASNPA
ncbi:MAG TPA: hypothetical protein VL051_06350, partial [Burkholderiaceae bacterium]|nr:hypothetical protein [Burkholderiaceae bacterium]